MSLSVQVAINNHKVHDMLYTYNCYRKAKGIMSVRMCVGIVTDDLHAPYKL